MYKIAISGLVALAAVLGGGAATAAAMTQPTATARPTAVTRAVGSGPTAVTRAARTAISAVTGLNINGTPRISCVTASDCLGIVGSSSLTSGTTTPTSIARWNGSAWKRAHVALPKGTRSLDLTGVSCKGAKSCLVVGDYYTSTSDSASNHALALIYNGTSLKPTPAVPLPKSTLDAALLGVSCTTARHCVAVGTAMGDTAAFGTFGTVTLIETWNGAKWTLHTVGSPAKTEVQFSGVSCATSAYCLLTGESFSETGSLKLYFRSWNGKKLTVLKPVAVGDSDSLVFVTDASCAKPSNCAVTGIVEAVTSGGSTPGIGAFAEVWNGKAWRTTTVPWPTGTAASFLLGVSCFGAHTCDAVGLDGSETAFHAAAASYNGTSWALQPVPAPAKGRINVLTDVNCLSATRCVAVGETGRATANAGATMTGVWNGTAWKLDPGF